MNIGGAKSAPHGHSPTVKEKISDALRPPVSRFFSVWKKCYTRLFSSWSRDWLIIIFFLLVFLFFFFLIKDALIYFRISTRHSLSGLVFPSLGCCCCCGCCCRCCRTGVLSTGRFVKTRVHSLGCAPSSLVTPSSPSFSPSSRVCDRARI